MKELRWRRPTRLSAKVVLVSLKEADRAGHEDAHTTTLEIRT